MGSAYSKCPSIAEFIDPDWDIQEKDSILKYLKDAPDRACTSRNSSPCVFGDDDIESTLCTRTDGIWLWLDDLGHYITHHSLRLPDAFVHHMIRNDFRMSMGVDDALSSNTLEKPPILVVTNVGHRGLLLREKAREAQLLFEKQMEAAEYAYATGDFKLACSIFAEYSNQLTPSLKLKYRIAQYKLDRKS